MLESLMFSQALLWMIVIVLCIVCVALARQIGVLYERIAPAGALAMNKRLSGGDAAPRLSLTTLTGETLVIGPDLSAAQRKSQLLYFLSPTCPICKTLLPVLKSMQRRERHRLDIVLASDGDEPQQHRRFIEREGLEGFPYVISEALGLTYGVSKLPYGVLINEQGIISALGLVNTREHLESLFEAQALGRATIQEYLDNPVGPNTRHDVRTQHESA